MLEERLLDRQQELQGMLGSVKSFLQDLADILSWLDVKEKDLDGAVAIATSEKEAKRRLKEHEVKCSTMNCRKNLTISIFSLLMMQNLLCLVLLSVFLSK